MLQVHSPQAVNPHLGTAAFPGVLSCRHHRAAAATFSDLLWMHTSMLLLHRLWRQMQLHRSTSLTAGACVSVVEAAACSPWQGPLLALQAAWLLKLSRQPAEAAQRAFSLIPDMIVRDLAAWISFIIRMGQVTVLLGACHS